MLTFINAICIADSVKSVNFAFDLRGALERCRPIQKARELSQCESILWSDARVAEEARLESVYTPKAYREFESRSLRKREEPILSFLYSVFYLGVILRIFYIKTMNNLRLYLRYFKPTLKY